MRLVMAVVVLGACVACASGHPPVVYQKAAVSAAQQTRDEAECAQTASAGGQRIIGPVLSIDRDAVNRCMRQRGYLVVERP